MCGIAGIFDRKCRINSPETIVREMSTRLVHRGPNMAGFWQDTAAGVYFGHRRLSIIDLSEAGSQPMQSASGRYTICMNGEIYNFRSIRREMLESGYPFHGSSDTEALLALIDAKGLRDAIQQAHGMYAFALWDHAEKTLSLVRDRAGEKPLYYYENDGCVFFASELKPLIQTNRESLQISIDGLRHFLAKGYLPTDSSIFQGVKKVIPGGIVSVNQNGHWNNAHYWELNLQKYSGLATEEEAQSTLESLLKASIDRQMIADVPLGAFLSGGIDSSLIVSLMQEQSRSPVKTFSVGFSEPKYDESKYARRVATCLKTDHHEVMISEHDLLEVVPEAMSKYDEPFADSSLIPTYFVMKYARNYVTVCLSGDGGDELFCGYGRYFKAAKLWRKLSWLPGRLRSGLGNMSLSLLNAMNHAAPNILNPVRFERNSRYARSIATNSFPFLYQTMTSTWQHWEPIIRHNSSSTPDRDEDPNLFREMRLDDFFNYLPNDILAKVDRAAMAVSLETRVPFLDHDVIEFAFSIDQSWHLHGAGPKSMLKKMLYRKLPRELFDRPKMGFAVPMSSWLRGPLRDWAEDLFNDLNTFELLNKPLIRSYWDAHLSGEQDWHSRLWNILTFLSWKRSQGV